MEVFNIFFACLEIKILKIITFSFKVWLIASWLLGLRRWRRDPSEWQWVPFTVVLGLSWCYKEALPIGQPSVAPVNKQHKMYFGIVIKEVDITQKAERWHRICTHRFWYFRTVESDRDNLVQPLYFMNDETDV